MKKFIHHLAYKFSKNPIAIIFVRPFWRMYEKRRHNNLIKAIRTSGLSFLTTLYAEAQKSNVEFWLDFGTLLGAIRNKGFISHDFDIDLAAWLKDKDAVNRLMTACGAKRVRRFVSDNLSTAYEETYSYKGILVDIFYYTKGDNIATCNSFGAFDGELKENNANSEGWQVKEITVPFTSLMETPFYDTKLPVPSNAHDILLCHYGPHYMIPNPNYDYKKEATNIHYFTKEECTGKLLID